VTPTIDAELKSLIPALADDELAQLEQNILTHGVRDAVVVWAEAQLLLYMHRMILHLF
jgi:hypothetical protein